MVQRTLDWCGKGGEIDVLANLSVDGSIDGAFEGVGSATEVEHIFDGRPTRLFSGEVELARIEPRRSYSTWATASHARRSLSIGLAGLVGGARFSAVNLAGLDLQCKCITFVSVTAQGADSGKDG